MTATGNATAQTFLDGAGRWGPMSASDFTGLESILVQGGVVKGALAEAARPLHERAPAEGLSAVRHLRVVLEYFHPWPNSSGFHVAAAQGWYRELGLDVDLRVFDPLAVTAWSTSLRGDAELAVFPSNRLFVRRELGEAVRGIAAINQRAPRDDPDDHRDGDHATRRSSAGRRVALNPTPAGWRCCAISWRSTAAIPTQS